MKKGKELVYRGSYVLLFILVSLIVAIGLPVILVNVFNWLTGTRVFDTIISAGYTVDAITHSEMIGIIAATFPITMFAVWLVAIPFIAD